MALKFGFDDLDSLGLRSPALIAAFSGWNDAAEAASDVLNHLSETYKDTSTICQIDGEDFYDYQVNRPKVVRGPEGAATIWPETTFQLVRTRFRDLILLGGPEPNFKWKTFLKQVMEKVESLHPSQAVILGAMLTDSPHSRPLPVRVYSDDAALRDRLRCEEPTYEGPTGIPGILRSSLQAAGIPTVSMWVSVPHYVATSPNPKATLALIRKISDALDICLDEAELPKKAVQWERNVEIAAGSDPDIREYVDRLEDLKDTEDLKENTGDEIADELERFLRHRDQNGHGGD
ncbi:PAC2 family protein [Propionimicrobium lymphophilum]|uniref:PAC2 family protein n=1 Tax=Propionimicrobium lymphophilum ACS-093-V-SCH5 TaxID=883161 RepID=S2WYN5_9ACTN|nr:MULTISPECIES: PAC2 family protein [Propionimicrobium]EPD32844.1 hypothetical protein HMPREF9306_01151 [Propionimicrobium lymphophilum ACS-093-V-SCH5]ETJ98274.1 PAC2 family protein [Propionimicrobium sp. BV2F7]MDK7710245.1 PAC2 family protein [Propionimicrobium lymphophilum]MDK7734261.1 PAC2 family protein [Propionimicrobium lymphophilum]